MRTPGGRDDQAASLPDLFWAVAHELRHGSVEAMAPWHITPGQFRGLRVLVDGPLRPSELADRLRIAPRSATEVVDGLEADGLAEREQDPADRRATLVRATAAGAALARNVAQAQAEHHEAMFAALTPAEATQLRELLTRLLPEGGSRRDERRAHGEQPKRSHRRR